MHGPWKELEIKRNTFLSLWPFYTYMALGLNVIGAIPGGEPRHFWEPE